MKVKFYLSRKKSNGKASIRCYLREYRKTHVIATGEEIEPELWKDGRASVRRVRSKVKKGELQSLNRYLDSIEYRIMEITRNMRMKNPATGFSEIIKEVEKQFNNREQTLEDIFNEFLMIKRATVSKASMRKFERIKDLLKEYEKQFHTKLTIEQIATKLFLDKFYSFLIEKQINNTANKNIQFLRTFLNWANTSGYVKSTNYKAFRIKFEKTEVVYLTKDEFEAIRTVKLPERLDRARDLFIFQISTGVRYSDLEQIERDDIISGVWKFVSKKTHQSLEIPLSSIALSILNKYKDYPKPLPVISNQKQNVYIKELCEIAGIDAIVKVVKFQGTKRVEESKKKFEAVGTHTARRTFISLSIESGVPASVVMAITGHQSYRMMQRYLKVSFNHKRTEMDKVFGSPLQKAE